MTTNQLAPFNYEILRTIIGWIAISIAVICSISYFCYTNIPPAISAVPTSISVSFHFGSIIPFVGLLFVVSAFLFAFDGAGKLQFWLSKLAAICAALVAIFPTNINFEWAMSHPELKLLLPPICMEKLAQDPTLLACNIYDWAFTPSYIFILPLF
ncbi:hypothetical protein RS130_09405 [Paraglaciecola aquimarina]|uniref:DUF1772 domain-containing protein n=1 Tax=Paraglaciecola aquimarina TaxID=1235557 RepID=A0ABU3SVV5_9ALTE|nr:hypothetical protein [Paraglaciecola aquimarina]MDU0354123.1 hypothetical protein [Paraglaciecola aquimarina]